MSISEFEQEIAELKAANLELKNQVKLMQTILDSLSEGVVASNLEGEFLVANPSAQEMAGMPVVEGPPEEWSETYGTFYPDETTPVPLTELPLYKAMQGETTDDVRLVLRHKNRPDGVFISVSGRPLYDESGDLIGGVIAMRDINQLEQVAKVLKTTNAQLTVQSQLMESIFNSISDGVFVADETGRIIMANPRAMQMADLLKPIVEPDEWSENYNFFYPDKVTPFPLEELPIMSAIRGESVDNVELFVNNSKVPDGVYLSASGRPLQDSEGNQSGGVIVFRDVTDRIRTEEALAQAFTQGRLEVVDTILHNIGNAINSVAVGIDTIHHQLTNDRLTPRLIALAQTIEKHQEDLSDYVKNDPQGQKIAPFILTLATDFDAVKQELQETVQRVKDRSRHIVDIIRTQNSYQDASGTRKDINLAAAISDAIKMLQDSIDKRQIQIEIDCSNAPQEIRIQESQFHQMLVNLIKNAVEAIDALAQLDDSDEEAYRIQCRAYIEDDFLCLDITDNGIGIPPEDLKRIFAAGFTTKEHGNGLGLHSGANFVISSGGKISAFSDGKGKGTTVRIMFRHDSVYRSAL